MVHVFDDIGMNDPFSQEACHGSKTFNEFETQNEFVYPIERLLNEQGPPRCIYLPSEELMWKLMRSGVGVTEINKLWFNQIKKKKEKKMMNLDLL